MSTLKFHYPLGFLRPDSYSSHFHQQLELDKPRPSAPDYGFSRAPPTRHNDRVGMISGKKKSESVSSTQLKSDHPSSDWGFTDTNKKFIDQAFWGWNSITRARLKEIHTTNSKHSNVLHRSSEFSWYFHRDESSSRCGRECEFSQKKKLKYIIWISENMSYATSKGDRTYIQIET